MVVEQFDNGLSLCWEDLEGELEDTKRVCLEGNEQREIGSMIWEDIKFIMDSELANKVVLTIGYEGVPDIVIKQKKK